MASIRKSLNDSYESLGRLKMYLEIIDLINVIAEEKNPSDTIATLKLGKAYLEKENLIDRIKKIKI